ncbi:GntR family transcriptional regulator [Pseudonocardia sp. NPDC049154]|uniref:GntR family transcriptional regulator n=1 Tax=Pseudonocardia sp. NPDC049154 TaxID=3155501 RepID=UPI0033E5665C
MIDARTSLARSIEALVERGRAGDRLPAERDLAERFGVGRAAVRKALSELGEAGRIVTHAQAGSFIR